MILSDKTAVLYGVSESLAGAVARSLAEADEVDALDEPAVNHHAGEH